MIDEPEILLDVSWQERDDGWAAVLVTASEDEGVITRPLDAGTEISAEVTDRRYCTGYADGDGNRHLCPAWREIDSGRQCAECRNRDAHRAYVEGRSGAMRDGEHSVYLAQCGDVVKVGVTRSGRLTERWVEQGAAFAAQISAGLTADQALDEEAALSDAGLRERIKKTEKIPVPDRDDCRIQSAMDEHGVTGEIVNVLSQTVYPRPECRTVSAEGRFAGELRSVTGRIIEAGGQCLAVRPGRRVEPPRQTGLGEYA